MAVVFVALGLGFGVVIARRRRAHPEDQAAYRPSSRVAW